MSAKSSSNTSFVWPVCLVVILGNLTGCDMYQPPEKPVAKSRPKIELMEVNPDFRKQEADFDFNDESGEDVAPPTDVNSNTEETPGQSSPELPTVEEAIAANEQQLEEETEESEKEIHTIEIPDSWTRLSPKQEIWVDLKEKRVIAGGYICLNAGPLEVFVCPRHTKEHESVVSINASSQQVHAALLAIGAEPGKPVQWMEEYKPATGDVIEVTVMWKQDDELVKRRGQEMILNIKTGKTMQHDWVFGGSIIEKIEATEDMPEQTYYLADSGELVCVSNFSTATLDVPVRSSDANQGLLFEANTPKIPDVGTKAYVVFGKKN